MNNVKSNTILPDNTKKVPLKLSELPDKQQAYYLLKQNGCTTKEAANSLNYKTNTAYKLNSKVRKYSLRNDKIAKDAHAAVKNILKGKTFGEVKEIKDSTVIMAAKMHYDRAEPVIQKIESKSTSVIITADMRQRAIEKLNKYGIQAVIDDNPVEGITSKEPILIGEND